MGGSACELEPLYPQGFCLDVAVKEKPSREEVEDQKVAAVESEKHQFASEQPR